MTADFLNRFEIMRKISRSRRDKIEAVEVTAWVLKMCYGKHGKTKKGV